MKYGYARVSTLEQDTAMQIAALKSARCDLIVQEQQSAVKHRPLLDELLQRMKRGDMLIIWRLDRLARSVKHLLSILEHLNEKGATLKSLTEPIDPTTAAGRMMIQVLGSVAEFERALIRERCMAGQAEAMKKGRPIGRPYKLSVTERSELIELADSGIPHRDIAAAYGVSAQMVWRLRAEATGQRERQRGEIYTMLYRH